MKIIARSCLLIFLVLLGINTTLLGKRPKLTLSMCVKNEASKYLRTMLEEVKKYIDEAVIIDDASTDGTVKICEEVLSGIPLHIIHNEVSKFSNEVELRQQQWNETLKTNPDWILCLDADEIFESRMKDSIAALLNQEEIDVYYFRLYDFWDEKYYRDDQYWSAHNHCYPFLLRYKKEFHYTWKMQPQHCGRFPQNISQLSGAFCPLRLKHYGWARPADRIAKYQRYKKLDPNAKYGIQEQYDSILDEHPHLVVWEE